MNQGPTIPIPTKKTVLEVYPDIYVRVRQQAAATNQTTKKFTTLLLQFGMQKLEAGEIGLVDALVTEAVPALPVIIRRKAGRKGGK